MVEMTIEQTATEMLIEAREFISHPGRWCQGDMALDEDAQPVHDARLIYAARCCGVGAAARAACRRGYDGYAYAILTVTDLLDCSAIHLYPESEDHAELCPTAYVNDRLGHAAILRVYDAAIAANQDGTA